MCYPFHGEGEVASYPHDNHIWSTSDPDPHLKDANDLLKGTQWESSDAGVENQKFSTFKQDTFPLLLSYFYSEDQVDP